MTRDEAIEKLWVPAPAQTWAMGKTDASYFVDRLAALGMLKLDKPKCARQTFIDAMVVLGYSITSAGMRDALNAFDAAKYYAD